MRSFLRKMSARPLRIADRPIRSAATALLLFAALYTEKKSAQKYVKG